MRFFDPESRPSEGWRAKVYEVIFETDTRAGFIFDIVLLLAILLSVVAVSLETVTYFELSHRQTLRAIEWVLTGLFTIEYILRLVCVKEARRYAFSLFGIIDLVSLLPTYLSLFVDSAQALQVVRAIRLLRVFRVFQLGQMVHEGSALMKGLYASRYKISVFLGTVMIVVVIQGALLYYLEHDQPDSGFTSIPRSVYWAIVTLTTVGYGDISPVTVPGQFIASLLMLLGYGIIAVPTGIVSAEVALTEMAARRETEHVVDIPASVPNSCVGPVPARLVVAGARNDRDVDGTTVWHEHEHEPEPKAEDPHPEPEP